MPKGYGVFEFGHPQPHVHLMTGGLRKKIPKYGGIKLTLSVAKLLAYSLVGIIFVE
jgi:hypothetical protein